MACALIDSSGLHPDSPELHFSGMVVFIVILLIDIVGLFRLGELLLQNLTSYDPLKLLRRKQLQVLSDPLTKQQYVRVFLFKSKGDPHGEGVPVYVTSHPNRRYCPVAWTSRYLQLTSKNANDLSPAFHWPSGGVVSKASFIRKLKQLLGKAGFSPEDYAGHSLRIGGAISLKRAGYYSETRTVEIRLLQTVHALDPGRFGRSSRSVTHQTIWSLSSIGILYSL